MRTGNSFAWTSTLLILLAAAPAMGQGRIQWQDDLGRAQEIALRENRLLLLHFWSDDCAPCRRLDGKVFNQSQVARAIESNYIPVKIHGKQSPHLTQQFNVKGWPTDIIVTAKGAEVHRSVSPQDPNRYIGMLDSVAAKSRLLMSAQFVNNPRPGVPATPTSTPTGIGERRAPSFSSGPPAYSASTPPGGNGSTAYGSTGSAYGGAPTTGGQTNPQNNPAAPRRAAYQQNPHMSSPGAAASYGPDTVSTTGQGAVQANRHLDNSTTAGHGGSPNYSAPGYNAPNNTTPGYNGSRYNANNTGANPNVANSNPTPNYGGPNYTPPNSSQPAYNGGGAATGYNPQTTQRPNVQPRYNPGQPAPYARGAAPPNGGTQGYRSNPNPQVTSNYRPQTPATHQSNPGANNNPQGSATGRPATPAYQNRRQPVAPAAVALDGYCPVTLSLQKQWKRGNPAITAVHRGRTYQFVSQVEKQRFEMSPDAYSPALSGYDPVSYLESGQLVPGQRQHGIWHERQMLLFSSEQSLERFTKAPQRYLTGVRQAMQGAPGVR